MEWKNQKKKKWNEKKLKNQNQQEQSKKMPLATYLKRVKEMASQWLPLAIQKSSRKFLGEMEPRRRSVQAPHAVVGQQ